ncbi:uncharacterized protein J3D65DRAFT_237325 [Phyllosticta citribraziliensis]|uniref:Uncharacterized protein n=1 Tax=Phyllosticta citribraziliensis TaxID=989973 RepID=A0ABR1LZ55_9PEZI
MVRDDEECVCPALARFVTGSPDPSGATVVAAFRASKDRASRRVPECGGEFGCPGRNWGDDGWRMERKAVPSVGPRRARCGFRAGSLGAWQGESSLYRPRPSLHPRRDDALSPLSPIRTPSFNVADSTRRKAQRRINKEEHGQRHHLRTPACQNTMTNQSFFSQKAHLIRAALLRICRLPHVHLLPAQPARRDQLPVRKQCPSRGHRRSDPLVENTAAVVVQRMTSSSAGFLTNDRRPYRKQPSAPNGWPVAQSV